MSLGGSATISAGKSLLSGVSSWAKSTVQWAKEGGVQDVVGKGKGIASKLTGYD